MVLWTTVAPGQQALVFAVEEDVFFIDVGGYELVRVPPGLGGGEARVRASFRAACPQCQRDVRHHELSGGMFVAECPACTFLWYRIRSTDRDSGGAP